MFKRKPKSKPELDPDTYGEGLLIKACRDLDLTLIKEHFYDEIRYIVKNGDTPVYNGYWAEQFFIDAANSARWDALEWAKEHRIGVTEEVLVP